MDPSPLHIKKSYKKPPKAAYATGSLPVAVQRANCAGRFAQARACAKRNIRPANAGRDAAVPPGGARGRSRKRSAFERPVRSAEPPRGASTSVGNCRRNRESARAFPRREASLECAAEGLALRRAASLECAAEGLAPRRAASLECGDSSPLSSRTLPLYGHVRKEMVRDWKAELKSASPPLRAPHSKIVMERFKPRKL